VGRSTFNFKKFFSNVVATSHSSCVFLYLFSSGNISPVRFVLNLQDWRCVGKGETSFPVNKLWLIYLPPSLWTLTMKNRYACKIPQKLAARLKFVYYLKQCDNVWVTSDSPRFQPQKLFAVEHTCFVVLNVFRHWRKICFFVLCFRNATIHVEMMRDLVNFFFGGFCLRDWLRIVVVFRFFVPG